MEPLSIVALFQLKITNSATGALEYVLLYFVENLKLERLCFKFAVRIRGQQPVAPATFLCGQ